MVDAIGSVSSQQIRTAKKDNAINWQQCTSDEIIEYEQQGQEIPEYILQWAKEVAKLENAPEDITYEMAGGATTVEEMNANQNTNAGNAANENEQVDPNDATAIREKMTADGASAYLQARAFRGYSDQYTAEIQNMMDTMEEYMSQAQISSAGAEAARDDVIARIQTLIARRNNTNTGDEAAAKEAARINNEIRSIGQEGLSTVQGLSAPVENAFNQLGAAEFTSLTGRNYGKETVNIGQLPELNGVRDNTGRLTTNSGEAELKQSDLGDRAFVADRAENTQNQGIISSSQDEISKASGAVPTEDRTTDAKAAENKAEGDNTVNDADNDQLAKESDNKKEEVAKEDPATVDDKVLSDPEEILKRKQKRGLV